MIVRWEGSTACRAHDDRDLPRSLLSTNYTEVLADLKAKVGATQLQAAASVNRDLVGLYLVTCRRRYCDGLRIENGWMIEGPGSRLTPPCQGGSTGEALIQQIRRTTILLYVESVVGVTTSKPGASGLRDQANLLDLLEQVGKPCSTGFVSRRLLKKSIMA